MTLKVVDVYSGSPRSYAQATDADAVIVKATQGTGYINPFADIDYQTAKRNGKLLGVYHYAAGGDPVAEAQYFYNNVKGYVGEAILGLDWEKGQNAAWGDTNWSRRFVDEVHRLTGVWPIIYVQFSAVYQVANCANTCGLWGAGYPWYNNSWDIPPFLLSYGFAPWKNLTGWQFTGNTKDRSIFYLDANGWLALAKGDGAITHVAQPETKPADNKVVDAPVQTTWKDTLGVIWHAENGKFTVGDGNQLHLRWGATPSSTVISVLNAGDVVKYDAWARTNGFVYARQPRGNGQYGYVAVRDANTNEAYGEFE